MVRAILYCQTLFSGRQGGKITTNIIYIGLGSQLENPIAQVQQTLLALPALPKTQLLIHSSLYQSAPLGLADQPNYINAVAGISTALSPLKLLSALQTTENKQGRVRNGDHAL